MNTGNWNRRDVLAATMAVGAVPGSLYATEESEMMKKKIPSSGEPLPIIGLGTYSVFDVDSTPAAIAVRRDIVNLLVSNGGSLIDTSPMYNRSEQVVGDIIGAGTNRGRLFLATKVWTDGKQEGIRQMQRSAELMKTDVIDLMQVHNLRDTELHMRSIREMQDEGTVRYTGLTHYTAGSHDRLAQEMKKFEPDFIQINYSLGEQEAADRLLPMAVDQGVAVLINRPFQAGRLFAAVSGKALPDWALEFADSWGQFFLKFIVSHPAVTCAIPATSQPRHMIDNLGAGMGQMPDAATRKRMADYFAAL